MYIDTSSIYSVLVLSPNSPFTFQYPSNCLKNAHRRFLPHPFSFQSFIDSGKCATPSRTAKSCAIITNTSSSQSTSCNFPIVSIASGMSWPNVGSNRLSCFPRPLEVWSSSQALPGQNAASLPCINGCGVMDSGRGRCFDGRKIPV
jgi:hypothetical protein